MTRHDGGRWHQTDQSLYGNRSTAPLFNFNADALYFHIEKKQAHTLRCIRGSSYVMPKTIAVRALPARPGRSGRARSRAAVRFMHMQHSDI